jgi:hypothetical protein
MPFTRRRRPRVLFVFLLLAVLTLVVPAHPGAAAPAAAAMPFDLYCSFLWGVGTEADQVGDTPWLHDTPARILTCWFNRHEDLQVFKYWHDVGHLARWQMDGYIIHVVTWEPLPITHGSYHTSAQWLDDISTLAGYLAGPPGLPQPPTVLWSLATELQTYAQPENVWNDQTAPYYTKLQANLLAARDRIKAQAPGSLVSLSWGGWQTSFDDPRIGAGLSMIPHFADTMRQMDFVSFQAMQSNAGMNAAEIARNAAYFHQYNPHLMIAHWKPDNNNMDVLKQDLKDFAQPGFVDTLRKNGVFAMSMMDQTYINRPDVLPAVQDLIRQTTDLRLVPNVLPAGPQPGHPAWQPVGAFTDTADRRFFREVRHSLDHPFLDYWTSHGGLPVLGYPLGEAHEEISPTDGKPYLVQYFERDRLEYHPANSPGARIVHGLLGRDITNNRADGPFAGVAASTDGRLYFAATRHTVADTFRDYWQQHGGVSGFGYPISEPYDAVSPTDGKTYRVQWFERARLEWHPELPPAYRVSLGLLGREYLQARGISY